MKIRTANIFIGKPNGTYHSVNDLFKKNPSLLLKRIDGDTYKILRVFNTPNECILKLRKLRIESENSNDYQIHTN